MGARPSAATGPNQPLVLAVTIAVLLPWTGPPCAAVEHPPGEKVEVNLVLLDVVVTDRKGSPVLGLQPEDFELIVDNTLVPIDAVEARCAEPEAIPVPPAAGSPVATANPRHFIVLFDMPHMMTSSRSDAIKATMQFVAESMGPGDRMMVLAFLRGLHVISDFSSDRDALRGRLERLLADRDLTGTTAFEESVEVDRLRRERRGSFFALSRRQRRNLPGGALVNKFECISLGRRAEIETARSIRAFSNTMPAFGGLPGRKAMVLFTETLRATPALPFLEACGIPPLEQLESKLFSQPEIRNLIERANSAGVSVYTVNAGGMSPETTPAGVQSARGFQTTVSLSTGGRNFVLMNNREAPFEQAARDLGCHYELAYRPSGALSAGRHSVLVKVSGRGRKVRHRSSFVVESSAEAAESRMMAVLSSPGLYRDLPVSTHGYSLGPADGRKRRFLLKTSVPLSDLVLVPSRDGRLRGSASLRGVVVADREVKCEFNRTVPLDYPLGAGPAPADGIQVGVEALCDLEPGEREVIIAARDDVGGALGAFWARTRIEPPGEHDGAMALLWGAGGDDVWVRESAGDGRGGPGFAPLFVRQDFTVGTDEDAVLTFLACGRGGRGGRRDLEAGPAGASMVLEGSRTVRLPARPVRERAGSCRLMSTELPAGTLVPGAYRVRPEVPDPWWTPGKPVTISVEGEPLPSP